MMKIREKPRSNSIETTVRLRENKGHHFSKSRIWAERENFYGGREPPGTFLVVGFDTEFKPPPTALKRDDIKAGLGKYEVLSYQVYCKLYDPLQPNAPEWGGVCYPEKGERLSLAEILLFALWKGIQCGAAKILPKVIYLAGHFTRADVPALSDVGDLFNSVGSVRNTYVSLDSGIPVQFGFPGGDPVTLKVMLRDTMLLTPAASKSLRALGDLVGQSKIVLDPDPAKDQWYKENMDRLLAEKPELFETYALTDAVICVRYMDRLLTLCEELLGLKDAPLTLSGIGVELLLQTWADDLKFDPLPILGKERVTERTFSKQRGHYINKKVDVPMALPQLHEATAIEAYHGGRNEQFWFGPGFEDTWTDYDLAGAYPTAMALIRTPDWEAMRVSTKVSDYGYETLGVAWLDFEFPVVVRFPAIPVRTDNGLVFPLQGTSFCAAPEIALAASLGAKITIRHGVIVPPKDDVKVFGEFIRKCVEKRNSHPKGSLENLFWKEVSNSTYGKTAQGLREKRVYDLRARATKPLPPSKITNPYFAAYITSFVRATLGEMMNRLPSSVCVFSCTTDGFLTNATRAEMDAAASGPLADIFRRSRRLLTGVSEVLEIKHVCRQPLGWRTRGQATLRPGTDPDGGDANYVLAKGGIHAPPGVEGVVAQNRYIVDLFFDRTPESLTTMHVMAGVRDMVDYGADLVEKEVTRRLSMEFDWKRRPVSVVMSPVPAHISFSTAPWKTVEEFKAVRSYWEDFIDDRRLCIKTAADYEAFGKHVLTKSSLADIGTAYLRKDDPDIKRLRQALCSAWRQSEAGLMWKQGGMSAAQFAEALTEAGVPCARTDVENGAKKKFVPNSCPPTPGVMRALKLLLKRFPVLDRIALLANSTGSIDLLTPPKTKCPFTSRLSAPPLKVSTPLAA